MIARDIGGAQVFFSEKYSVSGVSARSIVIYDPEIFFCPPVIFVETCMLSNQNAHGNGLKG